MPVLTFLYSLLWRVVPLLAPALPRSGKLGKALRGRRGGARALADWARRARDPARPLVWYHAASVGEGRQAEAVLRGLAAARPAWQLAYTFSSPSAERWAASLPVDVAAYVPCDTAAETGRALEAVQPTALVFSATDLWPELVRQAHGRGVKVAVTSATLAPTSSRRSLLARSLLGPAYAVLDRVGAIDEEDARRLAELGVPRERIAVTGDTRHDAACARLAALSPGAPHLKALRGDGNDARPVVVAGSTWPADERVLMPALRGAFDRGARFRLVVAPHEPTAEHVAALEAKLDYCMPQGMRRVRLSALLGARDSQPLGTRDSASRNADAIVVDVVGVLAELYTMASVAFVGGGFHTKGLHSVIEPAAAGVPVLFGPRWQGSRDARLLLEAGGARAAGGRGELSAALSEWLQNESARAVAAAAARAVVERGRGAADRSVRLLIDLVERAS
ncbi:MAG TPA: glycosyltransferase N-terminal domain-containing protein [Gemmatimonadales bacterium]|nr:glycosyltransferase N-terminal domain-containing protein [Gemmatimonadales bacterium]